MSDTKLQEVAELAPVGGSAPWWAAECKRCIHLRLSRQGKVWRCAAYRVPLNRMGYTAQARAPGGVCGPESRMFSALPNASGEGAGQLRTNTDRR
jgi:hypothetical protein